MLATTGLAVLVLARLEVVAGNGFCGGFDLDNHGQASQCLSDDNSRNGCYNIYGHSNPCWTPTSMSSCCGHGRCSGQYDRYTQHCTCDPGWTGSRCDTATAPPPSPPPASGGANSCRYAYDNECDDGSQGGTQYCAVGTDTADCSSSGGGSCPPNSHPNAANTACACDAGYVVNSAQTACVAGGGSSSGSSGQFTVTSGPCTLSHGGNCVGRPSHYTDSETCSISSTRAGSVESCPVFNTERGYDFLNIDGTNYDGTSCPRGVTLSSRSTISWTSDGSVAGDGWEICAADASDSSNSCRYANDGECDDGSTGGTQYCALGTDANDCTSGSAAASGGQFTVESGPCTTTQAGSCVGRLQYGDHESCVIRSNAPGSISSCPAFQTERGYDFLNIGGTNYDGTNCPQGVSLSGGTTIRWTSDGSVSGDGWQICTSSSSSGGSSRPPPPPSRSPPPPAPAPSCPSGERACGNTANCGWCISNSWDSGCLPSNEFGVMEPNPYGDCGRGYQAGQNRAAGSMCVSVISDQDVRCYQDCMPTATMETFIVPDQSTCLSYDSAFGARRVPFATRARAYEDVASHLIGSAVGKLGTPGHSSDCTRAAMGTALETLETEGLSHLETAACDALTDGAGAYFCGQLFEGSFGGWLNGQIVHSSIASQFNGNLINAATHAIPANYMDKIDQVCEAYQSCSRSAACSRVRSAVADAGAHLAQSHFGYGSGGAHRRLESAHRNVTDYVL